MAIKYRTKGFVFQKHDVSESDQAFAVFTKDFGRIELRAKAIRKITSKLRPDIDIFYLSEIEFIQGKNIKTLTNAAAIEKFINLQQDPGKFKIANGLGKILDNFIKGEEKDEDMFNLLSGAFYRLNERDTNIKKCVLLYYYFVWNALSLLGYRPEVHKCNICQDKLSPYRVYFSDKLGGIICKRCLEQDSQAQRINSDLVKILRLIFKEEWQILSRLKIEPHSQRLLQKVSQNTINSHRPF